MISAATEAIPPSRGVWLHSVMTAVLLGDTGWPVADVADVAGSDLPALPVEPALTESIIILALLTHNSHQARKRPVL